MAHLQAFHTTPTTKLSKLFIWHQKMANHNPLQVCLGIHGGSIPRRCQNAQIIKSVGLGTLDPPRVWVQPNSQVRNSRLVKTTGLEFVDKQVELVLPSAPYYILSLLPLVTLNKSCYSWSSPDQLARGHCPKWQWIWHHCLILGH